MCKILVLFRGICSLLKYFFFLAFQRQIWYFLHLSSHFAVCNFPNKMWSDYEIYDKWVQCTLCFVLSSHFSWSDWALQHAIFDFCFGHLAEINSEHNIGLSSKNLLPTFNLANTCQYSQPCCSVFGLYQLVMDTTYKYSSNSPALSVYSVLFNIKVVARKPKMWAERC